MITDPIADVLTRVRNAQNAGHRSVRVRFSKVAKGILEVLKNEGFIEYVEQKKDGEGKWDEYEAGLKYYSDGKPGIQQARRMSRPGRRLYSQVGDIPQVECGLGIAIVSTSNGIMSDREARRQNVGGELLAFVS